MSRITLMALCIMALYATPIVAQIEWEEFTVYDVVQDTTRQYSQFRHVACADLDNDGLQDVIAGCIRKGTFRSALMWFKNEGDLTFSEPRVIFEESGEFDDPYFDVGDIDMDGDIDIAYVTTEFSDSRILWLENTDDGATFEVHAITNMFNENCVRLQDMDGDDDLDVLVAGTRHTEWYRNIDGQGNFQLGERFYEYFDGSRHIIAGEDFDGDGDPDILYWRGNGGNWKTDDMHVHYNTDGQGTFSAASLLSSDDPEEIEDVVLMDVNADGERDLIILHNYDHNTFTGYIIWREIVDGQMTGNGGELTANLKGSHFLQKIDLDGDGDLDISTVSGYPSDPHSRGDYVLLLNDGSGQLNRVEKYTQDRGRMTHSIATDIDLDGKIEVIGTSADGVFGVGLDFISSTVDVSQQQDYLAVSPNPATDVITIVSEAISGLMSYEITDLNGKLVLKGKTHHQINIEKLGPGNYILQVFDSEKNRERVLSFIKL